MRHRIMDMIVEEVKRVYGEDRWPSDVEQKVREIDDMLRALFE